jgi:hypothetical protein
MRSHNLAFDVALALPAEEPHGGPATGDHTW